jgi:hypothetical protein
LKIASNAKCGKPQCSHALAARAASSSALAKEMSSKLFILLRLFEINGQCNRQRFLLDNLSIPAKYIFPRKFRRAIQEEIVYAMECRQIPANELRHLFLRQIEFVIYPNHQRANVACIHDNEKEKPNFPLQFFRDILANRCGLPLLRVAEIWNIHRTF